jgi:hypothetical protein
MLRTILVLVLGLAIGVSFLGCGGAGALKVTPATVTVTYKGKPVEGATVTLSSKEETGHSAFGVTNAAGVAEMRSPTRQVGAVAGEYIITVSKGNELPAKYSSSETSDLPPVKVTDGGNNNFKVDLKD